MEANLIYKMLCCDRNEIGCFDHSNHSLPGTGYDDNQPLPTARVRICFSTIFPFSSIQINSHTRYPCANKRIQQTPYVRIREWVITDYNQRLYEKRGYYSYNFIPY